MAWRVGYSGITVISYWLYGMESTGLEFCVALQPPLPVKLKYKNEQWRVRLGKFLPVIKNFPQSEVLLSFILK